MTRPQQRAVATGFLLALAALLIYLGFDGVTLKYVPAQYFGYGVAGLGVLAGLGVNVWAGGPLDPRNDPPPETPADPFENG
ncbi:MAG TPA: hypothetical protein VM597_21565 [Gemmataceae bacterium]|jgi:hypothetical protein|nr:hypothetical protein [Gemmataceae bacterium]